MLCLCLEKSLNKLQNLDSEDSGYLADQLHIDICGLKPIGGKQTFVLASLYCPE